MFVHVLLIMVIYKFSYIWQKEKKGKNAIQNKSMQSVYEKSMVSIHKSSHHLVSSGINNKSSFVKANFSI